MDQDKINIINNLMEIKFQFNNHHLFKLKNLEKLRFAKALQKVSAQKKIVVMLILKKN